MHHDAFARIKRNKTYTDVASKQFANPDDTQIIWLRLRLRRLPYDFATCISIASVCLSTKCNVTVYYPNPSVCPPRTYCVAVAGIRCTVNTHRSYTTLHKTYIVLNSISIYRHDVTHDTVVQLCTHVYGTDTLSRHGLFCWRNNIMPASCTHTNIPASNAVVKSHAKIFLFIYIDWKINPSKNLTVSCTCFVRRLSTQQKIRYVHSHSQLHWSK